MEITVNCPTVKGPNALGIFGDYVAGYGQEIIEGNNNSIYFQSTALPPGVSSDLNNYRSDSVKYEGPAQKVTCNYRSNFPNEPAFAVSYTLTNGKGGNVIARFNDHIVISLPVGFRA